MTPDTTHPMSEKRRGSMTAITLKQNASLVSKEESPLMQDINQTKRDIETILLHLDYQTDPDLIDCYSYELKGAYMRYKFLLRQIQEQN